MSRSELTCVECTSPGKIPGKRVNHMEELVLMRMVRNRQGRVGDWGELFQTTLPSAPIHWVNCLELLYRNSSRVIVQNLIELPKHDVVFGWQYGAVRHYVPEWVVRKYLTKAHQQMILIDQGKAPQRIWEVWKSMWPKPKRIAERLASLRGRNT